MMGTWEKCIIFVGQFFLNECIKNLEKMYSNKWLVDYTHIDATKSVTILPLSPIFQRSE